MVNRYEIEGGDMVLSQEGTYVTFADYASLEAQLLDTRQRWEDAQCAAAYFEAGERKARSALEEALIQAEAAFQR